MIDRQARAAAADDAAAQVMMEMIDDVTDDAGRQPTAVRR